MLILVGVTISITLGENGIIQKSKEASASQTAAQNKEMSELGGVGVESKIDAVVRGSGTQKISTKVTTGGGEQVYAVNDEGMAIYNIGDIFYWNEEGTWCYFDTGALRDTDFSAEIGPEWAEAFHTKLGINDVSPNTIMYGTDSLPVGFIKIHGCWYGFDGKFDDCQITKWIKFEPVDFDSSVFEGAVDYMTIYGGDDDESDSSSGS